MDSDYDPIMLQLIYGIVIFMVTFIVLAMIALVAYDRQKRIKNNREL